MKKKMKRVIVYILITYFNIIPVVYWFVSFPNPKIPSKINPKSIKLFFSTRKQPEFINTISTHNLT